ncbi:phage baseplate protein, partial [Haematospirillum jordaniae]
MNGTNAKTGKPLSGLDHLSQSIRDILTTPVGSRVMRRDYGSRLPSLVDAPVNRSTILELYAATAEALAR